MLDIIFDAGHGGKDPGAVGGGMQEDDIALQISLYQHNRANQLGLKAGITRTADVTMSLEEHAKLVANSGARICLCNHINAGGGFGAEALHSMRHKPALAQQIIYQLVSAGAGKHGATGIVTRASIKNPQKDYYRMHYTGMTETVIVEYGYIDNPKNLALLREKWQIFAEAALKAACVYLGKSYVTPKTDTTTVTIIRGASNITGKLKEDGKTWVKLTDIIELYGEKVENWDAENLIAKIGRGV